MANTLISAIRNINQALAQKASPKNYDALLTVLYRTGEKLSQRYLNENKQKNIASLDKDEEFGKFIKKYTTDNKIVLGLSDNAEKIKLYQHLYLLAKAWEDQEFEEGEHRLENRRRLKYKRLIDKPSRRAIHAGMFALGYLEEDLSTEINTSKRLSESLAEKISSLVREDSALRNSIFTETATSQNFDNAAKAITAFSAPTKKNRAIKITCILLALIVGITAGLATGGAIYLFLPQMSLWYSVPIAALVFGVGFDSNYSFFSENLPEFLHMVSRGELTKSIDKPTGKWVEMSPLKKYVLLPLACFFSLSVGIVCAALLVGWIIDFSARVLPFLASSVPLILGGVLGIFYGVGITIVMLYAFVKALKDPISLSKFNAWRKGITLRQIPGYLIKGILTSLVLFGLGFGCKVSVVTLVGLLSVAFPHIAVPIILGVCIGLAVVSFIGQVPFAVLSVNKFCDTIGHVVVKLFNAGRNYFSASTKKPDSDATKLLDSSDEKVGVESTGLFKLKSGISTLFRYGSLALNALGNAVLVVTKGSSSSIVAAAGAGVFSFAGNLPENKSNSEREKASQASETQLQANRVKTLAPVIKIFDSKQAVQEGTDPNLSLNTQTQDKSQVAYFDRRKTHGSSSQQLKDPINDTDTVHDVPDTIYKVSR